MKYTLKKENGFSYLESGEGTPLIILHGLMGNLSNFDGVFDHFSDLGYQVIMPELPIYTLPLLKTNVKNLSKFIKDFVKFKGIDNYILMGNSLGGHIALFHTKLNPKNVSGLVLTGSSGLYENSMGESYPKRGDYEYIKKKAQEVFYDPKIATKEVVDDVFDTLNNRNKLIRTIAIAKSAIRHNMAGDLPSMKVPTCLIWGKNDTVTPPSVAEEFDKLLPNSELHWIDKCGHAPMMESPDEFNELLGPWLTKYFN
ncbi:MAG: alpha/beta hydrolase [Flavobacteriales bacterium]|nr:alpha/beta hydrolase [Flavobacteriales bacterium]